MPPGPATLATLPPPPRGDGDPVWLVGVERYHAMIEAGIITSDDRVELLEGRLTARMVHNPRHRHSATRAERTLREIPLGANHHLQIQKPFAGSDSEPEPDLMFVRGDEDDYAERHPVPSEIALVVEVSDSSLRTDRSTKKRVYAREKIPFYWIVNLIDDVVEVYSSPSGPSETPDYAESRAYGRDEELSVMIDGREVGRVRVSDLLP